MIRFIPGKPSGETLVRFANEGEVGPYKKAAKDANFTAKKGEVLVFYPGRPARRVIVTGLGKQEAYDTERLRRAAGAAAIKARALDLKEVSFELPPGDKTEQAQAVVEGVALSLYDYSDYRSKKSTLKLRSVRINGPADAIRRGETYAKATCLARDLVNGPPSDTTPRKMAQVAQKVAKKGVRCKVYGEAEIRKMGMGAILGVAAGSNQPPRFVHMTYKVPRARRTLAIVGKGITFDSGGLCIKSADGMLNMKDDMSGAASVLAIMSALPAVKPRVNVHGIFPLTENMPGGGAYKTRDVLKAMNGKTIEIINTDAEGRLVLADALSYASRLKPDEIIDMATLTGACVVALGLDITAIFTKDGKLRDRLVNCSERAGEKIWPLPIEDDYFANIRSDVADMKNCGPRWGGSITAALLLQEFVDKGIPWAHLDIAGPALIDSPKPLRPAGGTGVMVRTLLRYLEAI